MHAISYEQHPFPEAYDALYVITHAKAAELLWLLTSGVFECWEVGFQA